MREDTRPTCLLYLPFTYDGGGVPQTAASLLPGVTDAGLEVRAFIPRVRRPLPEEITTRQTLPVPLRYGKWRHVWRPAVWTLERAYRRALRRADPTRTVAWFWPSYLRYPSVDLISEARSLGIPTVREMVSTATATSGPILDALYEQHGHPGFHNISDELIAHESHELPLYDYIFASNPEVEHSLTRMGIDRSHILPTTFGWSGDRFPVTGLPTPDPRPMQTLRFVFVGIVGLRKGVPDLLEAWRRAGIDGELLLVGGLDHGIRTLVEQAESTGTVKHVDFTSDIAEVYRSSDVFVFPTHEEGGPQVVYEAAAWGLPIITTPMGAARLVRTGVTGIVVPAGDIGQLTAALCELANAPKLREGMGAAARSAAADYEYHVVGRSRGQVLRQIAVGGHPVAEAK